MRIGVLGPGSVGLFVGGCLASAGAHVVFVGRKDGEPRRGPAALRLTDLDGGDRKARPETVRYSADAGELARCDLVLVSVKSGQTKQAAVRLEGLPDRGQPIVNLQNGLGNAAVLKAALPNHRVLRGMVPFNVVRRGPSHLHRATAGRIAVEGDPSLDRVCALFSSAGLPLDRRVDIEEVQWAKLMMNLNNAINALSGLPLREQLGDRRFRQCLALAQEEALSLLGVEGRIRPARLTAIPAAWMPALLRMPDALFTTLARRMLRIDAAARSSMADDLEAGRATEVDVINGEIVALARRLGRSAPVNRRLCELVGQAADERSARWSSGELLRELTNVRGRNEGGAA